MEMETTSIRQKFYTTFMSLHFIIVNIIFFRSFETKIIGLGYVV